MPAVSKSQRRLMGWAKACDEGKAKNCPSHIKKTAKGFKDKGDLKKMAKTKHKGLPERMSEGYTIKQLIEGMTFQSFLIAEAAETPVLRLIRTDPIYRDLLKDQSTKPEALKLAKRMMADFGNIEPDANQQAFIRDAFQDLYSGGGGGMVGDWAGEEAYQRQEREQKDIDSAMGKWEKTTGMDAETGDEIKRPRRRQARTGMSFMGDTKAANAKAELAAFADAPAPEQATRVATAQSRLGDAPARPRGGKMAAATAIFDEMYGQAPTREIIARIMSDTNMGKSGATTYFYTIKKKKANAPAGGSEEATMAPAGGSEEPRSPIGSVPAGGGKMGQAKQIFAKMVDEEGARPSVVINQFMNELGISKPHATTYYYNIKKKRAAGK